MYCCSLSVKLVLLFQGRPYTTASKTRLDVGSDELTDDTDGMDSRLCPALMQPVQDGSGLVMRGQCKYKYMLQTVVTHI